MHRNVFYAGSFDPFTVGHLSIVKKCCSTFEKVFIGIGCNSEKLRKVDANKMKLAIEETLKINNINNAEVIVYEGLTVEAAKQNNCSLLIRGIRNGTDYQYEENIASINEKCLGIDTIYFRAGELGYISSSMVMELFNNGQDIKNLVPLPIYNIMTGGIN